MQRPTFIPSNSQKINSNTSDENEFRSSKSMRVQHQGTPNDVRMFPMRRESSQTLAGSVTSSPSIPIAHVERSESEIQLEDDEAKAQFREKVMYDRIFNGLREKKAASLKSNDQTQTSSDLPFFPALPNTITLHDHASHVLQSSAAAASRKLPIPTITTNDATWRSLETSTGHNIIGTEFFLVQDAHGHALSSEHDQEDDDGIFEMDM